MESIELKRITVIGPGMMGYAIAQEFATAGYDVVLCGRSTERLEAAVADMERNLVELARWEIIDEHDIQPALSHLQITNSLPEASETADLVIEAIVEELEIKHRLFHKLDALCPRHTIFASNTSTLLPSTLAEATKRPDRFLVAHYFNPPYLMPLVEIVRGRDTSDERIDAVYNLMKTIGKSPIICQKEAPGFIANRMQLVLWREAFNIVQRGIASPQDVDLAVKQSFGRRLGYAGPFEIFEHNDGYDLTLQCEKYMLPDMDTSPESYPLLLEMVAKGALGAKTGRGFYEWTPEFTQRWRTGMLKNLVEFRKREGRNSTTTG